MGFIRDIKSLSHRKFGGLVNNRQNEIMKTEVLIEKVELIYLAVYPLGQSTWTAAPNSIAQTNQYVRNNENL